MLWLFWIGAVCIVAYELLARYQNKGGTISEMTWRLAGKYPILSFAAGFVCGHLFWQWSLVYLGRCK